MPLHWKIRRSSEPEYQVNPDTGEEITSDTKPVATVTPNSKSESNTVNMLANALIAARNKLTQQQTE
jgi:hypothetical protein